MSRTRLILLGLLVVAAVSVVATASTSTPASASGSCSKVSTAPAYCVEGAPLASGTPEKFEGTNVGESVFKSTVGMVKTEIKCGTGKSKGTIEDGARNGG